MSNLDKEIRIQFRGTTYIKWRDYVEAKEEVIEALKKFSTGFYLIHWDHIPIDEEKLSRMLHKVTEDDSER